MQRLFKRENREIKETSQRLTEAGSEERLVEWNPENDYVMAGNEEQDASFCPVEKFLGKRNKRGILQYLVQWAGLERKINWVDIEELSKNSHWNIVNSSEPSSMSLSPTLSNHIDLPNEILAFMFCFLDKPSFLNVALVSKRWLFTSKMIQPEFNLISLVSQMTTLFGDNWFKDHLIGNLPKSWSSYPIFPLHYKLAHTIISESSEPRFLMYPASWKGTELLAIGIVWKEDNSQIRHAVMQRTNYWNENGRMRGIAVCSRKDAENGAPFQHWHQSHGRLSMEDHLEHIPKGHIAMSAKDMTQHLHARRKLSILHIWREILSGNGPEIPH